MSDTERLQALAAFLPEIESPAFDPGAIVDMRRGEDGSLTFPYARMSGTASQFVKMLYANNWITFTEWMQWSETKEALRLRQDPDFLSRADASQLCKLLTMCIRRDRFCEGALLEDFKDGLVLRIVRRADILLRELMAADR